MSRVTTTAATESDSAEWKRSICPYCGVGCGMQIRKPMGHPLEVCGMPDHPASGGRLCHLALTLPELHDAGGRLTQPMVRRNGELTEASWDEALQLTADQLTDIRRSHGRDAFAMYISASEYIEEYHVYAKFVKGCLGTNNLESSARLCWASGVSGIVNALGADAPPCTYEDLEHADLHVLSGYNISESKPVLYRRLIDARRGTGARLLVVDPRNTRVAAQADLHLRIKPGRDVALHNGIARELLRTDRVPAAARARIEDLDALARVVEPWTIERVAEMTGLSQRGVLEATDMLAEAERGLFLWGQGLNQSRHGTAKVSTFLNLALLTGNIGRVGAGPLAITGQTSAMSLREVGALPHLLPGFRSVTSRADREETAGLWGVEPEALSARPGLKLPDILEAIDAGEIRALWVIHANPAATFPDTQWTRAVLKKLDILIVQDAYHPTQTTALADVLLPAAQWGEKTGTMTNSARGISLAEQVVQPPGTARSDWRIVCDVAKRMGFGQQLNFADEEAIFEEYKLCTRGRPNDIMGLSHARLRDEGTLQWPVPSAEHGGTPRRFLDGDFPAGALRLGLHDLEDAGEEPDAEYPLVLITGVRSPHYHSGTRTGRIRSLAGRPVEPCVDVHPADASTLGLKDGRFADVTSRRGSLRLRVLVTDVVPPGTVFVPYHSGGGASDAHNVNVLTHRSFDETAMQPEYKFGCVRVVRQ